GTSPVRPAPRRAAGRGAPGARGSGRGAPSCAGPPAAPRLALAAADAAPATGGTALGAARALGGDTGAPAGVAAVGHEVAEGPAVEAGKPLQLQHVDPALSRLALGDEGLRPSECGGHLDLRQPRGLPSLVEAVQQASVARRMGRAHGLRRSFSEGKLGIL